ncbi:MAG: hypothetical protein QGI46_13985 [Planctomycetota bacterium]|nr:hypothetical protein [Planctomycetota bacterium]
MNRAAAVLAWALSAAPCAAWGAARESLGDASRLALATVVWLALVGLPAGRRERRAGTATARAWPRALGLALPPAACAAWLDLRAGHAPEDLWTTAVAGLLLFVVLGEARRMAARAGGDGLYALAWLAIVPGTLGLRAALDWAALGPGEPFAPVVWLAERGPLDWAFARLAPGPEPAPWISVAALAVGLWAAGAIDGRRARAGEELR